MYKIVKKEVLNSVVVMMEIFKDDDEGIDDGRDESQVTKRSSELAYIAEQP